MNSRMHAGFILILIVLTLGLRLESGHAAPSLPAVASPRLGADVVISAADADQYNPSVAYNSQRDEYFVVWHNTWPGPSREVWASRVSAQGNVVDTFKLGSAASANDHSLASVAYDPTRDRYLVVWIYDYFGDGSDWDLHGRFVPWNGPDPGLSEFPISQWASDQWDPQVAYAINQDEFLVTWTNIQVSQPAYISAQRITADGSGFPAGSFTVADHASQVRVNPNLAYNNWRNQYLVVYDNGFDIFGVRVDGAGNILDGGEFTIAGWPDAETYPAVASCPGSDQYLVLWHSLTTNGDYDIFGRFYDGARNPGQVFTVHNWIIDEQYPAAACSANGARYLVGWEQKDANFITGIWARTIDTSAAMGTAVEVVAAGTNANRSRPALAGGAPGNLFVWEHGRDGAAFLDIHGRLFYSHAVSLPLVLNP